MLKSKKSAQLFLLIIFTLTSTLRAQPEFRGVWIAWAGSNIPSKEKIAQMMDDLAAANMNTAYVDIWRYGYPYFYSQLYHDITGLYTDPALDEGRDVLADMIAEGHRVGLHVEAWFEYGFVACQGDIDHIYDAHPEWFAQRRDGSILFNGEYRYKWLSHCNPQAQQFLIDLCQEVARNYDVDGIELDRIRYPELDCGYDAATVALYAAEHSGTPPPQNIYDSAWMLWRSQKLTAFTAALYDSLKAVRPDLPVSNAPIVYPYGYENFCQDWRPWINSNYLDVVSPQVYRASSQLYLEELNRQMAYVTDLSKFYPGLTTIANDYLVPTGEILTKIQMTRNRGLQGHVIWFYDTLVDDLPALVASVYQENAEVPGMAGWRKPALIVNEDDSSVTRSTGWIPYSGISGYQGGCLYATSAGLEWIEYRAVLPESGWYEVYCYLINHWNAAREGVYLVYHANGVDTLHVDQAKRGQARWYKLGDYYLNSGTGTLLLRITNENLGSQLLFTDAVMVVNSNRPEEYMSGIEAQGSALRSPLQFDLAQNYPNPYNPRTIITFSVSDTEHVSLSVFDVRGQRVATLVDEIMVPGRYAVPFEASALASGIYLYTLRTPGGALTRKMIKLK